ASEQGPRIPDLDDTEERFKALSLSALDARRVGASGRHPRRHRLSSSTSHELVFDPAPPPAAAAEQTRSSSPPVRRAGGRLSVWRQIASALRAFHAWFTGAPLRRVTTLVLGLTLLVLLGNRGSGSTGRWIVPKDRRAPGSPIQALAASQSVGVKDSLRHRASRSRHGSGSG